MKLISNYKALEPTVTDISNKIKTVSSKITYFIITKSMIESLHVYIKSINDTISTRIQLLQYMKDNKETFEEHFQKLYNAKLMIERDGKDFDMAVKAQFLFFKIVEAISIYYLDETKYEQKIK